MAATRVGIERCLTSGARRRSLYLTLLLAPLFLPIAPVLCLQLRRTGVRLGWSLDWGPGFPESLSLGPLAFADSTFYSFTRSFCVARVLRPTRFSDASNKGRNRSGNCASGPGHRPHPGPGPFLGVTPRTWRESKKVSFCYKGPELSHRYAHLSSPVPCFGPGAPRCRCCPFTRV